MKSILQLLTFSVLLLGFITPSIAQIEEASIKYTITAEGGMASMFTGSTMELCFNPTNAKVLANVMSGAVKLDARLDNKNSKGIMLMDMMGQKKVIEMGKEDLKEDKTKNQKPPQVEYIKKYKKIAGYKCQQVKMSIEGSANAIIIYITDKIKPANFGNMDMLQFTGFKGFPLAWEYEEQGISVKMEATSVSLDKLPKSAFDLTVPKGYEKMDMKDLEEMGGSFGL